MQIYFVADTTTGENYDLFVLAQHPADVVGYWQRHYELRWDSEPERVFLVPGTPPEGRGSGVLQWHADLEQVGGALPVSR